MRAGVLVAALLAAPALATVRLETRTVLLASEVPGGPDWPLLQWLDVSGVDTGTRGLSVHASLWGLAALGTEPDRSTSEAFAGDVSLLYAQLRDPDGRFSARLGRQLVFTGPGAGWMGHLDGLWVRGAGRQIDLQLYGGRVVTPRFSNLSQYDWLAGGRVGFHRWDRVSAGVSFLHARNDGRAARESLGADLLVWPRHDVDLHASGAVSTLSTEVLEARAGARWRIEPELTVALDGGWVRPGALVDQSSIFSVFAAGDWAEVEGSIDWAPQPAWLVRLRYARVHFPDVDGRGFGAGRNRMRGALVTRVRNGLWATFELGRVPTVDNGYTSARLAAHLDPDAPWSVAVDLLGFLADAPPLPTPGAGRDSVVLRLFGAYALTKDVEIGLGGEVGRTVLNAFELRADVRVLTRLDLLGGGS